VNGLKIFVDGRILLVSRVFQPDKNLCEALTARCNELNSKNTAVINALLVPLTSAHIAHIARYQLL
jgi:hypothetical protein